MLWKKLNKILIPSLTALTFATALTPLTSCSKKFDGKVTEQEWKDATAYLTNYDKSSYWSFSGDNSFVVALDKEILMAVTNGTANPGGFHYQYNEKKESGNCYVKYVSGFPYMYQKINDEINYDITPTDFVLRILVIYFSSLYNYYNVFEFKDDKYYHYTGSVGEYISLDSKICFNSDKKISHFDNTLINKDSEGTWVLKTNVHPNYETKTIEYPKDFTDRIAKHSFKINNSINIDTSICEEQEEGLILDIEPDKASYTKLCAYDNSSTPERKAMFGSNLSILKNEKKLEDAEWSVSEGYLKLETALAANDHLSIAFKPQLNDATYTFKLEE